MSYMTARQLGEINRQNIIDLLRNNPDRWYSIKEICDRLGMTDQSARVHCKNLVNCKQIREDYKIKQHPYVPTAVYSYAG